MSNHRILPTVTFFLAVFFGIFAVADSVQANYNVSPIRAELSSGSPSTILTVRNTGAQPVRVQARVYQWKQDETGKEHLSPTENLTFFPRMLEITPGQARSVRLGLRVPVGESEQSYRIIFEELPGSGDVEGGNNVTAQLSFRTRLSIPVFVKPPVEEQAPRVSIDRVARGRFQFSIHNDGNVHFRVRSIQIKGLSSSSSEPLLNGRLDGWYVLPGTPRRHVLRFPQRRCGEIDELQITVETTVGTFSEEMTFPANTACVG